MIESPDIINRLRKLIEESGSFFAVFDRTFAPRSRVLELIDVLSESLPEELELAREILEKKEQVFEEARQQAGEIVDQSVRRGERLIDADAITVEAKKRADDISMQTDKYVIERLLALEDELTRILDEVRGGIAAMGDKTSKD